MKHLLQLSLFLTTLAFTHYTHAADKTLDGTYDVELTIGDKVFHDILEMHGKAGPLYAPMFGHSELEGTMTVPGAFTAAMTGAVNFRFAWPGRTASFSFSILADENGQQYKVYYDGMIGGNLTDTLDDFLDGTSPAIINGYASVDGENGHKARLGTFRAVRREQ